MITERVASLLSKCATMKVILQEREYHLRAKEMKCEVFWLNLTKEKECRAEEERRTKDLQRQIVALETKRMELWGRVVARTDLYNEELHRANELTTSFGGADCGLG